MMAPLGLVGGMHRHAGAELKSLLARGQTLSANFKRNWVEVPVPLPHTLTRLLGEVSQAKG